MNITEYIDKLKARYTRWYDVLEDEQDLEYYDVDLRANYFVTGTKHMLSKKIKLFTVEEAEYCFVKKFDRPIDAGDVSHFTFVLERAVEDLVHPDANHKRSVITGVMVTDSGIEPEALQFAKKYKKVTNYNMMVFGWSEIRLVLVDTAGEKIYHNIKTNVADKKYVKRLYDFFKASGK